MSQRHTVHEEESKKLSGLKIKNAKYDDCGVYTLVVENPYGADQSSGQVIVVSPNEVPRPKQSSSSVSSMPKMEQLMPEEKIKPPRVIKHLQQETLINEGQPLVLNCLIEGEPTPKV